MGPVLATRYTTTMAAANAAAKRASLDFRASKAASAVPANATNNIKAGAYTIHSGLLATRANQAKACTTIIAAETCSSAKKMAVPYHNGFMPGFMRGP